MLIGQGHWQQTIYTLIFWICLDEILYAGITSWFVQYHEKSGACAVIQNFFKWHEVDWTFAVVSIVREMATKKYCKYGEYGSFEHLLFLCYVNCILFSVIPSHASLFLSLVLMENLRSISR